MVFNVARDKQGRGSYFIQVKPSLFAPIKKITHRPRISQARVLIADGGEEELEETLLGPLAGAGKIGGRTIP